jgi:ribosomal-protein-alanine N-acetyltransferase
LSAGKKVKTKDAAVVGERVYLRAPLKRDEAEFVALNRASVRLHRGLVSPPVEAQQFEAWLKRSRRKDIACFLICRVEDGAIVGAVVLSQIVRFSSFRSAYLGYYVGEPYSGKGYMTEAIQLMLRYAFEHLRLHRLEANIQPENAASIALVRRAGFRCEGYSRRYVKISGRWRDHERWAILDEDWRAARKSSRRRAD